MALIHNILPGAAQRFWRKSHVTAGKSVNECNPPSCPESNLLKLPGASKRQADPNKELIWMMINGFFYFIVVKKISGINKK